MIEEFDPKTCFSIMQNNTSSIMIDVRMSVEYDFIGHPPEAIHIAWKEFPGMTLNTNFVEQVCEIVQDKSTTILLLCRSGVRSMAAAKALEAEGYQHLINIAEGFEGDLDNNNHRGNINGWRFHGLPWLQS